MGEVITPEIITISDISLDVIEETQEIPFMWMTTAPSQPTEIMLETRNQILDMSRSD